MLPAYTQRYAAQIAALGPKAQRRIRNARVHISGFGGLGNLLAVFLQAAGVGWLSANDPQVLEADNLGRFLCGNIADLGQQKVYVAEKHFATKSDFVFQPLVAATESDEVNYFYQQADWIVCASNSVQSRLAAATKAVEFQKPIIDVGVADGRVMSAGTVKYRLPECSWSACPACYLAAVKPLRRGEGLLFSVLATTAGLCAHILLELIAGRSPELRHFNLTSISLSPPFAVESMAVAKRPDCPACGIGETKIGGG